MKLLSLVDRKKEKQVKQYIVDNKDNLYRIAYSYVKNEDDALDVVHDSIIRILSNIDKIHNIDSIKNWVYKIVVNCAIDYIRKNKKYIPMGEGYELENIGKYDTYENIDLINALDDLPESYKAIIILRYFEDMKINDIAQVLDENPNTIKTRLYKALDKLKKKII